MSAEGKAAVQIEATRLLAHYCKLVRKADRNTVKYTKKGYTATASNFVRLREQYQAKADALSRTLMGGGL